VLIAQLGLIQTPQPRNASEILATSRLKYSWKMDIAEIANLTNIQLELRKTE
jgi:hypothetical protein